MTTPAALQKLLVPNAGPDASRTLMFIEACDAAGWVHDLAAALGVSVKVAHCCQEGWKCG